MKIYVKGVAEKKFAPQTIMFSLKFTKKFFSYKQAYTEGNKMVNGFLNNIKNFNYKIEHFKTTCFNIQEECEFKYNRKLITGYVYNRVIVYNTQYSMEQIAKMFSVLELFKDMDKPSLKIEFGLTNTKQLEAQVLAEAYENAKLQAEAIANVSDTIIQVCFRTSFEPFDNSHILSSTTYNENFTNEQINFTNQISLVPDITIKKHIYCGFEAKYKQDEQKNSQ